METGNVPYRNAPRYKTTKYGTDAVGGETALGKFARDLHTVWSGSPRTKLYEAVSEQSLSPQEYSSPAGKVLLERRYGRNPPISATSTGPRGNSGTGVAHVPGSLDFASGKMKDFYLAAGKEGIANHELEHAMSQDPGSYNANREKEVGPAIGDMVFASERFSLENNKPLDHTVRFPGGSSHSAEWMQQQAKRHGYWDGRSMTELLFGTDAGRQWLRSKMDGSPGDRSERPLMGYTVDGVPPATSNIRYDLATGRETGPSPQRASMASLAAAVGQPPVAAGQSTAVQRRTFNAGSPVIQSESVAPARDFIMRPPVATGPGSIEANAVAKEQGMQSQGSQPAMMARSIANRRAGGPVSSSQFKGQPSAQATLPSNQYVPGPDIAENNANIAAMAKTADGMVATPGGMAQHLSFSDLGNRSKVNSGTGVQLDYGNLPSSNTQLMFADRNEQKGQRADALMASVANPTVYNGITVSPGAIARNKTMSGGDLAELQQNGWEVADSGVIRRAPRKQTGATVQPGQSAPAIGGGDLMQTARQLYPARMASGMYDGKGMSEDQILEDIANSVARSRQRYGLRPDGTSKDIPNQRSEWISSRTDISDEEKYRYLGKAYGDRASRGASIPDSVRDLFDGNAGPSGVQGMPHYNPGSRARAQPPQPISPMARQKVDTSGKWPSAIEEPEAYREFARAKAVESQGGEDSWFTGGEDIYGNGPGSPATQTQAGIPGNPGDYVKETLLNGEVYDGTNAAFSDEKEYVNTPAAGSTQDLEFITSGLESIGGGDAARALAAIDPDYEGNNSLIAGAIAQQARNASGFAQAVDMDPGFSREQQASNPLSRSAAEYGRQRDQRMQGSIARGQYFDSMRQKQAMAQEQAMVGQIARAAMMGNPQAMQMMDTIRASQTDAARLAMQQADMQQRGMAQQAELGLRKQEIEQRGTLAQQMAGFEEARATRSETFQQSQLEHNQRIETLAAERSAEEARSRTARDQTEQAVSNARIAQINKEMEVAQFEFDQRKKELGIEDVDPTNIADNAAKTAEALRSEGYSNAESNMMAKAKASEDALREYSKTVPQAASLLAVKDSTLDPETASPYDRVDDFFDRVNQTLNMFPARYGRGIFGGGVTKDGTGGGVNPKLLEMRMSMEGIDRDSLEMFISQQGNINQFDYASQAKQNLARVLLGMEPIKATNTIAGYGRS
jgi:hypothetical protein